MLTWRRSITQQNRNQ